MKRILAVVLTVAIVLSFCLVAFAGNVYGDAVTLVIDLTGYNGQVNGGIVYSNVNYSVEPKRSNSYVIYAEGEMPYIEGASIGLPDMAESLDHWEVTVANGTPAKTTQNGTTTEIIGSIDTDMDGVSEDHVIITLTSNTILFAFDGLLTDKDVDGIYGSDLVDTFGAGSTVTLKPVFKSTGGTAPTVVIQKDAQGVDLGTVSISNSPTDGKYILSAFGRDAEGDSPAYSFAYWVETDKQDLPENQITTNNYEVASGSSYTAYFREAYQLTVRPSDETRGTATAERKWNDTYTLTAAALADGRFAGWFLDEGGEPVSAALITEVTLDKDSTYTARFDPPMITAITNVQISGDGVNSYKSNAPVTEAKPLIAESVVKVKFTCRSNSTGIPVYSYVEVYAGNQAAVENDTATLLAGNNDGSTWQWKDMYTVEPWKAEYDTITVKAWTKDCAPQYATISDIKTTAGSAGLDLTYLSSPQATRYSYGGTSTGPDIYGTAAFVTGSGMDLYIAGIGGVYHREYDGQTDMVRMKGMEDLRTSADGMSEIGYALAVGGNGTEADGLSALVATVVNGSRTYELRWYNAEAGSWKKTYDVPSNMVNDIGYVNKALIMETADIWTTVGHWDGIAWTQNDVTFDSFLKVDANTAYARAGSGAADTYQYDPKNGTWTKLELGGKLLSADRSGHLLVELTDGGYAVMQDGKQTATYPAINPDIFGDVWTLNGTYEPWTYNGSVVHTVGFGGDGNVYALIDGSKRTYIALGHADTGTWEIKDTSAAYGVGTSAEIFAQPKNPNQIENVADGVSVLYGKSGALYLQTATHTVTFMDGDQKVAERSGQVWSTFVVPIPDAREGYTFAGWYDADGNLWSEPVIPMQDLTLTARWTASSEDRWAKDRAQALQDLEDALERFDKQYYTEGNYQKILDEAANGRYRISIADPQPENESQEAINKAVNDTIYKALNTALARMNAVPMLTVPNIKVVVSMDAQTIGLGYAIKPTIVEVPMYTLASHVVTDQIIEYCRANYPEAELLGITTAAKGESSLTRNYAYTRTGTLDDSFYLAQVYWPNQKSATVADYIVNAIGNSANKLDPAVIEKDRAGRYLGEFDYYGMSGWMYSISNINDDELPSFPGVGAAGWRLRDGEVMRWQFTVYGYGADLNADNSAWGQESITGDSGDKTELTYKIAQMREEYKEASTEKTYKAGDNVLETSRIYMNVFDDVLCDPLANQAKLDAAVADLDLVAAELENADALTAVTDKILAMGTVKLENGKLVKDGEVTAESGPKIEEARKAYDALNEEQKKLFGKAYPEYLEALEAAKKAYEQIKDTEAAKKAAAEVDAMINALPDPDDITLDDKDAIDAAMKAYEDLSEAAKGYVENHNKLVACKEAYDKLNDKPNPPTPPTPPTPSKPTTPSKPKDDKPTTGASFTDVPSGSWYADAVNYVSEKGLMNGTSKNSFSPNATTTRGMIVTILARVEGVNTNGTPWYAAGQKWAMDNGISDGTNMTGEVTREQLAAILYRYAKLKGYATSKSNKLDSFKDADKVSSWAVEAMQWANAESLINGKSNSMLDPQGKATRAETAAILMRFMENIAK